MGRRMTAPCYRCPNRHEGCHSECEDYKAFGAERERLRQARALEGDFWGFARAGKKRRERALKNERRKK